MTVAPRKSAIGSAAAVLAGLAVVAALHAQAPAREDGDGIRTEHVVDTPFYTMRGPEIAMIALIQTGDELEYIGDYMALDAKRASSALRLLRHVDFDENMLLVVNAGPMEGVMLRVESVYEENGELNVDLAVSDLPPQYDRSDFGSPASNVLFPSLVTVLPRFQGRVVVHTIPGPWATAGDLRGVFLWIVPLEDETGDGENTD